MRKGLKGRFAICAALALGCTALGAQAPAVKPQFEIASVKPVAKDQTGDLMQARLAQAMRNSRRSKLRPGEIPTVSADRVRLQDWPLLDLVAAAYSVRATEVSGPAWLADQGFDLEALLPDGAHKEDLNAMLQSLLEERFGLQVHRETQTLQGYALTVAKGGPKLTAAAPPLPPPDHPLSQREREALAEKHAAPMRKRMQELQESGRSLVGFSSQTWDSVTCDELARGLRRYVDAPVVDETELIGKYAVTIETSSKADAPGGTIFDAVEMLGLKLVPRKMTADVVVVDQASRMPTEN